MAVGDENDTSRKDGNPKPNATFKKIMFQVKNFQFLS